MADATVQHFVQLFFGGLILAYAASTMTVFAKLKKQRDGKAVSVPDSTIKFGHSMSIVFVSLAAALVLYQGYRMFSKRGEMTLPTLLL